MNYIVSNHVAEQIEAAIDSHYGVDAGLSVDDRQALRTAMADVYKETGEIPALPLASEE